MSISPPPAPRWAPSRVPFVENRGQHPSEVAYSAATAAGTVFVTREGRLVYALPGKERGQPGWTLIETLHGDKAELRPGPAAAARVSVFRGTDPERWRQGLPTYQSLALGERWPGIQVSLRMQAGGVEKLFSVAPGADLGQIRLGLDGVQGRRLAHGALVLQTGVGELRLSAPRASQEHEGQERPVTVAYRLEEAGYGFAVGDYDRSRPLYIDPLLQASYLGGSGLEEGYAVAVHPSSGEVYVAGTTASADFPGTAGGPTAPGQAAMPTSRACRPISPRWRRPLWGGVAASSGTRLPRIRAVARCMWRVLQPLPTLPPAPGGPTARLPDYSMPSSRA
jgi:hypothetical protein